ncbi:ABC protein [Mycena pura]|uniref:ABC protein n=1 Tax=Mycena pura TaxID=153505 RepID=A0AAD6V6I7_9AGAR|nr:ABC protein [Mycena pura]
MASTQMHPETDSDDGTVRAESKDAAADAPAATDAARDKHDLQLDAGIQHVRVRQHWWQIWVPGRMPPPPPASLDAAPVSPYVTASLFSRLTYTWITPLMVLGFQRTLQASDLWRMGPEQEAGFLAARLEEAWARRLKAAEAWNARLDSGEAGPGLWRRALWGLPGRDRKALEQRWRTKDGRREASLTWALNDVLGHLFWRGGMFKVVADTSQLMGPILVKSLINFAKARALARETGAHPASIAHGIGLAVGLLCVIVTASICQHQFFFRSMSTGVLARGVLTATIYERAVYLTPTARRGLPNAQVLNHVSADISRVDNCAQWFHAAWTAPIQTTVCLIILLVELGPSALAGFALFLIIVPIQERLMASQFALRVKSLVWTDKRASVSNEVMSAMRVVKYFCYERSFLARILDIRKRELGGIKKIQHSQSANIAMAFSLPVIAATLAFVTYTEISKAFDVAVVFASFSLFQLLRQPMMFLPRALSATADARTALARLSAVFNAPLREGAPFAVDTTMEEALRVDACGWVWEGAPPDEEAAGAGTKGKARGKDKKAGRGGEKGGSADEDKDEKRDDEDADADADAGAEPFRLHDITMRVPRGTLAAIVGRVGSGKSSLLQGLIGEMRQCAGATGAKGWALGGRVAYCPQSAWIQNATLRDNVLFGQRFDEARYWRVIEDACLLPDLKLLADGDLTEVRPGEKGINLSGGQKQRVNIARALYYGADIILFDDPLSAVDANVGKALFRTAILGLVAQGKTVLLVTHALHFLSQCDYIYTLDGGRIAEAGTFEELIARGGAFARLDAEFGGQPPAEEEEEESQMQVVTVDEAKAQAEVAGAAGTGKLEGRLMVKERRTTGGVSWSVYGHYLKAGGGWKTVPFVLLSAVLMQSSQVANSYALVWWQENTFHKPFSFYQVLYALLGIAQAIFTYALGICMDLFAVQVSNSLHRDALVNVLHAPMSFFDTTPMGRIIGIFGKDIDTIDNSLPMSIRMCMFLRIHWMNQLMLLPVALVFANVLGSVIVITIIEHYFLAAAVVIMFGFGYFLQFYRASALEMKRLDSMLRSLLYAHLSESLTGLPTIRSYGELDRFVQDNKYYIDLENRALFLTVTNQRWLAVRLDALGSLLVFLVGILAAVGVSGISAAQVGLILTYTTSLTQMFAVSTRLSAEVENYMNSVERVVHFARGDVVPKEAAHESDPQHKPAQEWPARGAIEFKDVTMAYRPGLPNVLHGISLQINAGEKIGVVGRTGAGKSSLTLCLLRIVEYSGQIVIDDVDIGKIGLTDLRSNVAIIPQEPTLFSGSALNYRVCYLLMGRSPGTVRTALDPFSKYDDGRLWDALKRSYLVETRPSTPTDDDFSAEHRNRITLDTAIETEGANLSVGERSLLSLARALVKDSRVVILDEATASVDLETDNKIQRTIQTQFRDQTLICIAHRLRTIISYDRILVLDSGRIAEFDTPAKLFHQNDSLFRALCDKSNITFTDIEKAIIKDDDMD